MTESKPVTTRLPLTLIKRLKFNAVATGRNITEVIVDALTEHLAKPRSVKREESVR